MLTVSKLFSKKMCMFAICLFAILPMYAECLVLGVDVDCSVDVALTRFQNAGFVINDKDKFTLIGNYRGHKVVLQLTPDKKTNIVGWVGVYSGYSENKDFPSWTLLKSAMMEWAQLFKDKYQVDCISSFEFQAPFKEGDGNEFQAICSDKAKIFAAFLLDKDGLSCIKIYPTSFSPDQMMIIIHFYNKRFGISGMNQ